MWTVKFGEVHSDVFASRLLLAVGYLTEPTYFVNRGSTRRQCTGHECVWSEIRVNGRVGRIVRVPAE